MILYDLKKEKIVNIKVVQTENGIRYVSKLTKEQLFEYGFCSISYQQKPDRKYYTFSEKRDIIDKQLIISYESKAIEIDVLKANSLKRLKTEQSNKLNKIDWYWQRKLKTGKEVPDEIITYANEIYSTYEAKEKALEQITTVEEIMEFDKV